MESNSTYLYEAERISDYLLGVRVAESEKNTYAEAMRKLNISFSSYEKTLWSHMLQSKFKMACIDAGLALKEPNNNVRRKIFTMLAIMEASPNHISFFLSREFSFFYIFKIALVGMRAVCRAAIGTLMVNRIRRRCS